MSRPRSVRLIRVQTPTRSADFAIVADAPARDVTQHLVTSLGEEPSPNWQLQTPGGQWLGLTRSLKSEGIRDGDILHLTRDPAHTPAPAPAPAPEGETSP